MYPSLFSKSLWNKWKMKHAKFWKVLCQILFRFWKNEERFWRGQYCVEKALNELLFWYDQISSWVQRKKAASEIVKCTKKFCVLRTTHSHFQVCYILENVVNNNTSFGWRYFFMECAIDVSPKGPMSKPLMF